MKRPEGQRVNASIAFVEIAADGAIRGGLTDQTTMNSVRLLAARALEAIHEFEVSAVRQQLGVAGTDDAVEAACTPLKRVAPGAVVAFETIVAARVAKSNAKGLPRATQPRQAISAATSCPSSPGRPLGRAADRSPGCVIPFRNQLAQGHGPKRAASFADAIRVELVFAGRWPATMSIQTNGLLDALMKLRAADAMRELSTRLLEHEQRYSSTH